MNRGSADAHALHWPIVDRFNEAPIHESGKCGGPGRGGSGTIASFNEAPIHESGKCEAAVPALERSSGFNEAPIHESGK